MRKHSTRQPTTMTVFGALAVLAVAGFSGAASAAEDAFAAPIADEELAAQRGREGSSILEITSATAQLDGTSTHNVATGNTNGGNVIRDSAFSGLNGHATVIQNSGNNNVIQDSTIYNFSLRP